MTVYTKGETLDASSVAGTAANQPAVYGFLLNTDFASNSFKSMPCSGAYVVMTPETMEYKVWPRFADRTSPNVVGAPDTLAVAPLNAMYALPEGSAPDAAGTVIYWQASAAFGANKVIQGGPGQTDNSGNCCIALVGGPAIQTYKVKCNMLHEMKTNGSCPYNRFRRTTSARPSLIESIRASADALDGIYPADWNAIGKIGRWFIETYNRFKAPIASIAGSNPFVAATGSLMDGFSTDLANQDRQQSRNDFADQVNKMAMRNPAAAEEFRLKNMSKYY
jgi:hypothetical protein